MSCKLLNYVKLVAQLINPYAFVPTLFFNFYYLPFKQAYKLPIWVYKPHFLKLKGKVKIDSQKITPMMVRLGFMGGHMYPNNGFYWTNEGEVVFKGKCIIGNNSFIVTGEQGRIVFGDDFIASTSMKIISFIGISFGTHNRVGYETVFMDTNFHPLFDLEKECFNKAYGPIKIGNFNWFSTQCFILHDVVVSDHCTFGLRSVLTNKTYFKSNCLYCGNPIKLIKENIIRKFGQDKIYKYVSEGSPEDYYK